MATSPIHVMVAILRDARGRVLISQRPAGKPQAGRWEFPGGKLEANESPEAGLRRELLEELGIVAGPMRRLIEIRHAYPDFTVLLDVREVAHFGGAPRPQEGQALHWVAPDALPSEDILEADRPVIHAVRLPETCLITPDPSGVPPRDFLAGLDASLAGGIRLVQLRAKSLSSNEYRSLAQDVSAVCRRHDARLLLNHDPQMLTQVDADGVHLDGVRLRRFHERPVPVNKWLSASCHSRHELHLAARLDADFTFLSPVAPTASHRDVTLLGWRGFATLAAEAVMPVYALGGMREQDVEQARRCGGQGIAAIRGLWRGKPPV